MKIAIIGYGIEGKSSFDYFSKDGSNQLTICDQNEEVDLPKIASSQLGANYLDNLDQFDLIVRSSGIKPELVLKHYPELGDKITTQLNQFLKVCPSRNTIGITGTKGKGTTSTLIAKILEASGKQVVLGGNIGIPMLSMLDQISKESFVVLELSSFQLVDLRELSTHLSVCLMVVPEHLNWHPDLSSYLKAKSNLFRYQTDQDTAIHLSINEYSKQISAYSPGKQLSYFDSHDTSGAYVENDQVIIDEQIVCSTDEIKLLGKHNLQNVCAAITACWQISHDLVSIRLVLSNFEGLEHRLELVDVINGVKFYDDSFGTTPETAAVAVEAVPEPKVLIAGGSDKGSDYRPMIDAIVSANVKQVVCIGDTGYTISELLKEKSIAHTLMPNDSKPNIGDVIEAALQFTVPGDAVLLSTGSASFDMFDNYKDRGDKFKQAVHLLAIAAL
jgi:UDP-N-acetylmuramoylalanine--D-glutamate ligase